MANLQLKNNAYSALAAGIGTGDTSITVTTGQGDRFPAVGSGTYFKLTLQDASNNIEVIKVTARTSGADSMTVTRAQEGTTARSWSLGDAVELRVTSGILAPLALLDEAATIADFRTAINVPARTGSTLIGDSASDTMTVESTATFNGPTTISAALTATTAGNKITVSGTGSTFTVAPATAGTLNNVAIGGATAAAGAFTTLAASSTVTLSGGTANGVLYLNGSKVATSGSGLVFDGTNLLVGTTTDNGNRFSAVQSDAPQGIVGSFRNSGTGGAFINIAEVGVADWSIGQPSGSGAFAFYLGRNTVAAGSEFARLTTTGYFKASNTGTYLNGNYHEFYASTANEYAAVITNANSTTPYGLAIRFSGVTGGSGAFFIDGADGDATRFRVLGSGDIQNANNSYGAISDPKVKNIIGSKGSTWGKTKAYNWIEYYLKSDVNQENKMLGLNAAEALIVSPGVISYSDDTQPVTKTRTVTKTVPVTVTEQQEQTKTETQFIDGAWREITTTQTVDVQVPVYDEFPLVDANGDPVMELVSPAVDAVLDEDGNEIEPAVDAVYAQKVHKVARTEEVTETEEYTENEPTGEQTMAVKYSIVSMLYHRTVQEAQHRIEALEVANADLLSRVLALESA